MVKNCHAIFFRLFTTEYSPYFRKLNSLATTSHILNFVIMKFLFAVLSFTVFSLPVFAQVNPEDDYDMDENIYDDIIPKHSFTIELGLPVATSNKPYQSMMMGLVKFAPYYQFTLKNHLSFGLGANYSYFKANEFRVPEKVVGGIHSAGGFIKVGYEQFHSMRFGTDFGIKAGYTNTLFDTDVNRKNGGRQSLNCVYIEPTAAVVLTAGEYTSYRFVVGYSFQGYDFNTSQLGIQSTGGYKPADFNHVTQYITFGFGFTYYFKQW